jgi:hypothetical protein
MATVVNFIDTTLQAAATRTTNTVNANVLLDASTNVFHVNGSGANDPASITFTYSLIELDGPATFAITGGTLTTSGNVATLTYANMPGSTASVTASVTVNGVTFTSNPRFITKVLDGASGTGSPGARGAGQYFATGSAWSDATADAATPGANIAGDVVTISNATTFVGVRGWSGSAWVAVAPTYDGGAIFPGTVTVNQINANSLVLRDASGNPLVGLGVPLAAGLEAPGTKNSDVTLGTLGQRTFRVVAMGNYGGGAVPATPGLYLAGAAVYASAGTYNLAVIRRSDGVIIGHDTYDVAGSGATTGGRTAATLAADLNFYGPAYIVVVWSSNEPQARRFDSALDTAMYRCGASRSVYGSAQFKLYSSYILVGIPSSGEGNGQEAYQGAVDSDPNAWCDVGFSVVNGVISGISGASAASAFANATINDATTGLAARLRNNAANVLSGGAGIAVGSLTWNTSGVRTGGYGLGITSYGIACYNSSGVATISVNATTGAIAVLADISGSTGTFGDVIIGTKLYSGMTAWSVGSGIWMENVGGVVKVAFGSSTEYMRWSPLAGLELKLATFSVVLSGTLASTVANGSIVYGGLVTATITGGVAPFTYSWSTTADSDGGPLINYGIYSGQGTSATAYRGSATNNRINASITVIVTDSRGFTATGYASHVVTHGTYIP